MSRLLLLIRHAQSRLTTGLIPSRWPLTDAGREACIPFASSVAAWKPNAIFTSNELKAKETGGIIAGILGLPLETRPGLHEHMRPAFDRPAPHEDFIRSVESLFAQPDELVFGEETASAALSRFDLALHSVLAETTGTIAVISHGTVMALWIAKHRGAAPMPIWRSLRMPDLVTVEV